MADDLTLETLRERLAEESAGCAVAWQAAKDWKARAEQAEAERDTLTAAATSALDIYRTHYRTTHPRRLVDSDCLVCRMGVLLSAALPRRVDSREDIERLLDQPTEETPDGR